MRANWKYLAISSAFILTAVAGWLTHDVAAQAPEVVPITVVQRVRMTSERHPAGAESGRALVVAPGVTVLATRDTVSSPNQPGYSNRMIQFADGRKVDLFDPVRLRTTYRYPARPLEAALARMSTGCLSFGERLGTETLAGVPVVKFRWATSRAEITRWVHVASGCTEVQSIYIWKRDGAEYSRTENMVASVSLGWADPALLAIPDDYPEVRPSVAAQAMRQLTGRTRAPQESEADEHADWTYQQLRASR